MHAENNYPRSLIGACGDNCTECPRFVATKSGDKAKVENVLNLWKRLGWRPVDTLPEQLLCAGCDASIPCANSPMRDCAFGKGLETCGTCTEFPCSRAETVFKKTETMAPEIRKLCSTEEFDSLEKAFFRKRKTLNTLHRNK